MEAAAAGQILSADGKPREAAAAASAAPPLYAVAIAPKDRKDDVRLSGALDQAGRGGPGPAPSAAIPQQMLIAGQGEATCAWRWSG